MELKKIVKQFTAPKLMKLCVGLVGERDAAVSGFVQGVDA